MDDLSFSRTQYPKSETTRYLNGLASKIHLVIYKNKREEKSRFITFWTVELPTLIHSLYRYVIYAFAIFAAAMLIGVVSVIEDDTFARLILSDAYVNMTLENIENGNPMGVYANGDSVDMFFSITFNNIRVSFMAFALGIAFSLGTVYIIFRNGLMVGAFFTFLGQHSDVSHALSVVMLHGTIELTSIVIAGAAGFRLGHSLLFPKTYSRSESLKRGAKDGMKLVMALVPLFIIAGFIESFLTRYENMPGLFKTIIIGLSSLLIVYYFFVYPLKFRSHAAAVSKD